MKYSKVFTMLAFAVSTNDKRLDCLFSILSAYEDNMLNRQFAAFVSVRKTGRWLIRSMEFASSAIIYSIAETAKANNLRFLIILNICWLRFRNIQMIEIQIQSISGSLKTQRKNDMAVKVAWYLSRYLESNIYEDGDSIYNSEHNFYCFRNIYHCTGRTRYNKKSEKFNAETRDELESRRVKEVL